MKKRLFFAILLDKNSQKEINSYQKEIKKLDKHNNLRVVPDELHLTILFLGYQEEENIEKIKKAGLNVSRKFKPFEINLEKIEYGPRVPYRLIWLKGKENKNLENLKQELEKELEKINIQFQKESRKLIPHITLFRIKNPSNLSPKYLEKSVNFSIKVKNFHLMESILKAEGPTYLKLEEFSFF